MNEILKADKNYRNKILVSVAAILLIVIIIRVFVFPKTMLYLKSIEIERSASYLKNAMILLFLGFLPIGAYFIFLAKKILKSNQFPPPGTKVIRDTPIIRDKDAKTRAYLLIFLALIMIILSLAGCMLSFLLINSLIPVN